MKTIDCRGQQCPQPVIQTRKLMLEEPGNVLEVLVDDQACQDNVSRLATTMGYHIATEESGAAIRLELSPGKKPEQSRSVAQLRPGRGLSSSVQTRWDPATPSSARS